MLERRHDKVDPTPPLQNRETTAGGFLVSILSLWISGNTRDDFICSIEIHMDGADSQ